MRITRKTATALAVSGALTVGAALVATAAVFSLPVFGFGPDTSASAEPPPTSVVERTVYDDHYVTRAPAGGSAAQASCRADPAPSAAVPVASTTGSAPRDRPQRGRGCPGTRRLRPLDAPAPTTPPTTTKPPTPTTTRPPIPAGCQEPEWEPQDGGWHCKGN